MSVPACNFAEGERRRLFKPKIERTPCETLLYEKEEIRVMLAAFNLPPSFFGKQVK
jgi:hypothetical protein